MRSRQFVCAALMSLLSAVPLLAEEAATAVASSKGTHKQVRVLRPTLEGGAARLHTFCVDGAGNLLCCVSVAGSDDAFRQGILKFSPEGELLAKFALGFEPTAVNLAQDGSIYVAGAGRVAKLDPNGKVITETATPNMGDPAEFQKRALEAAQEQRQTMLSAYQRQVQIYKKQIAETEQIPEGERTAIQNARLKTAARQLEIFENALKQVESQAESDVSPQSVMAAASRVTGLAVSDRSVFVVTRALQGYGYEVWKTSLDLQGGEKIRDGLSGCCGQLDIQATGDKVLVAENSRFRVLICEENGKDVTSFGKKDRESADGFGSCCNPMNIRCCANGDILCAESSIGNIKRFNDKGEFLGLVGKARISGGCKHVAIGFDPKRDYYYLMNITDNSICVLVPLSEAPEFTEDEKMAAEAKAGLGQKLVGTWVRENAKPTPKSALGRIVSSVLGGSSSSALFDSATFGQAGDMQTAGGMYAEYQLQFTWDAVKQCDNALDVSILNDGVEFLTYRATFVSDDEMQFAPLTAGIAGRAETYRRQTAETQDVAAENK